MFEIYSNNPNFLASYIFVSQAQLNLQGKFVFLRHNLRGKNDELKTPTFEEI